MKQICTVDISVKWKKGSGKFWITVTPWGTYNTVRVKDHRGPSCSVHTNECWRRWSGVMQSTEIFRKVIPVPTSHPLNSAFGQTHLGCQCSFPKQRLWEVYKDGSSRWTTHVFRTCVNHIYGTGDPPEDSVKLGRCHRTILDWCLWVDGNGLWLCPMEIHRFLKFVWSRVTVTMPGGIVYATCPRTKHRLTLLHSQVTQLQWLIWTSWLLLMWRN